MQEETQPDDGIVFHGEADVALAVEDQPADLTGGQTDDAIPEHDDAEEVNATQETSDAVSEETEDAEGSTQKATEETEEERLKKMQHSLRVKAFETRELKRKLKEAESQKANASPAPQEPQSDKPKVPRMSDPDIEYDEDKYVEKLEDYNQKSAAYYIRQEQQKLQEQEKQNVVKQTVDKFVESSVKLQENNPEYAELVNATASVHFSPAIREAIVSSDTGADLHYEILKDAERLDRINSLPPIQAMREIIKIEASIGKAPQPKPKPVSSAPKPVKVSKGASAQGKDPASGITFHY